MKLHEKKDGPYVGLRGGRGRINVDFQRYVCFETVESAGGLCECTDWGDVHVSRKMKQYLLGGRLGYKGKMSEHFIFDLYVDYTKVKYVYPAESAPLIDAYCGDYRRTKNPFNELPIRSENFADKIFWLKSGQVAALLQIGLKLGYAF